MKYEYKCKCGYKVVYETDERPPKSVKCRKCKSILQLKNEDVESLEEPS